MRPMTRGLEATIGRPAPVVRFAVIGDYGLAGTAAARVAALVGAWNPDFVITTGDNNYPVGAEDTIDQNVGQYYHAFIHVYKGSYGEGADYHAEDEISWAVKYFLDACWWKIKKESAQGAVAI